MSQTWFTSDTHFGHKRILDYCDRPWAADPRHPTKEETRQMDEDLIANWNKVVRPEDTVYHLGDFAYCCSEQYALEVMVRLNGKKHVIRGNHDQHLDKILSWHKWLLESYTPGYLEAEVNGQTIILCHYSFREWHHCTRGTWMLYGHTHGMLPSFGKSVDVGIDNCHVVVPGAVYRPISFDELKAYMDKQPIGPHPVFEHYRPGHPEIKDLKVLATEDPEQWKQEQGMYPGGPNDAGRTYGRDGTVSCDWNDLEYRRSVG